MYGDVVLGLKPESAKESDPFEVVIEKKKHALGVKLDTELTAEHLKELVARVQGCSSRSAATASIPHRSEGAALGRHRRGVPVVEQRARDRLPQAQQASPQRGARPSTCRRWCSATWATRAPPASPSRAIRRTGEKRFYGEFLINAQGEDVVAGIRTPQQITLEASREWAKENGIPEALRPTRSRRSPRSCRIATGSCSRPPTSSSATTATCRTSSSRSSTDKLYMLQTRNGKRTAARCRTHRRRDGGREAHRPRAGGAARRCPSSSTSSCTRPSTRRPTRRCSRTGLGASPGRRRRRRRVLRRGRGRGQAAKGEQGHSSCASRPRPRTSPAWSPPKGILTATRRTHVARRRGRARHGQVLRGRLRGAAHRLQGQRLDEDRRSHDRQGGRLDHDRRRRPARSSSRRSVPTIAGRALRRLQQADGLGRQGAHARACAPTPTRRHDAARPRALRRRRHRPVPHRAHVLRGRPHRRRARDDPRDRRSTAREKALAKLLPFQRERLRRHLRGDERAAGDDPPARPAAARVPAARRRASTKTLAKRIGIDAKDSSRQRAKPCTSSTRCSATAAAGSAITYPEIYEMQARAIIEAALDVPGEGHQGASRRS